MKFQIRLAMAATVAVLSCLSISTSARAADSPQYSFKIGDRLVYRFVMHTLVPGEEKTMTGYLMYLPKSYDSARGQTTLQYKWGVAHGITTHGFSTQGGRPRVPGFLAKDATEEELISPEIVVDSHGIVVNYTGTNNDAQLDFALGPAWKMMLQPLPIDNKTTWVDTRKIGIRYYHVALLHGFPTQERKTDAMIPADETFTYTVKPAPDNQLLIQTKYQLKTEPAGKFSQETNGDGDYSFDVKAGFTTSVHMEYASESHNDTMVYKTTCRLAADLVTGSDLTKLEADAVSTKAAEESERARLKAEAEDPKRQAERAAAEARQAAEQEQQRKKEEALAAAQTAQRERAEAEAAKNAVPIEPGADVIGQMPDGVETSEILGGTQGGGPFVQASSGKLPVLGFRIETGPWAGGKRFRMFDALFQHKNTIVPSKINVVAREGYAVGAITVNADKDSVNAICITFMKKTDTGLDPKVKYVSPWYGQKKGPSQKVLTGNGGYIFGITGRKGLNVDAIGILIDAPPGDDSNK